MEKEDLFGKTLSELTAITKQNGLPTFTARQMSGWLYKSAITDIDEMSNISKANRGLLKENYSLKLIPFSKVQVSHDGTRKYLFPVSGGRYIEAAYIPEINRSTLCISSQVGCKMGCLFCMTGKQGFQGNLSSSEILNQVRSLPEREALKNIVYMGMGEPFDNITEVMKSLEILTSEWGFGISPKRITVSTIGIIPAMKTFIEQSQCHLAVSLHTPFEEERNKLMPIETVYSVKEIIQVIKQWDWSKQRRISFEYIMFRGINDTKAHIMELTRMLNGLRCRINLIRFHPIPGTPLEGTKDEDIIAFRDTLNAKGIIATIRRSRGEDISAACGLLSTKEFVSKSKQNPFAD